MRVLGSLGIFSVGHGITTYIMPTSTVVIIIKMMYRYAKTICLLFDWLIRCDSYFADGDGWVFVWDLTNLYVEGSFENRYLLFFY